MTSLLVVPFYNSFIYIVLFSQGTGIPSFEVCSFSSISSLLPIVSKPILTSNQPRIYALTINILVVPGPYAQTNDKRRHKLGERRLLGILSVTTEPSKLKAALAYLHQTLPLV